MGNSCARSLANSLLKTETSKVNQRSPCARAAEGGEGDDRQPAQPLRALTVFTHEYLRIDAKSREHGVDKVQFVVG